MIAHNGHEIDILNVARRHVFEGRRIVAEQRALVERFRERGLDTRNAERSLDLFRQSLAIFEDHLRELEHALHQGPTSRFKQPVLASPRPYEEQQLSKSDRTDQWLGGAAGRALLQDCDGT